MDGVNDRHGSFDSLPHSVQQVMRENSRTLPLLFTAPPPALSCDDLNRLGGTPVVVARGDATRTFYKIAAQWATAAFLRPHSSSFPTPGTSCPSRTTQDSLR
jgi:hypothetical protein